MELQEIFKKSGYINIVNKVDAAEYKLFVDMFYEEGENIPQELKYLYISKTRDELFFVLDGRGQDISSLCEMWDRKISAFMTFGSSDRDAIEKLKYNAVQIVLYEAPIEDCSKEGSLNVTRKLFIPCIFLDNGDIEISDNKVIEIPFYLIEAGDFEKDTIVLNQLGQYLPTLQDANLDFLCVRRKSVQRRLENKILKKNYEKTEYKMIKEWLKTYADTND